MPNRKQKLTYCRVGLYGQCASAEERPDKAWDYARKLGAQSICFLMPPQKPDEEAGLQILETYVPDHFYKVESGILKRSGQAFLIESRDCPILILEHQKTGDIGVSYAGQDQLVVSATTCCTFGIIEKLLPLLQPLDGNLITAYVTGGISAAHYECDLYGQIQAVLKKYGIQPSQIKRDGLCTYSEPWLSSERAGKDGTNWTIVVKQ